MTRIFLLALLIVSVAHADEKLKGIACRSVHLSYPAPEGSAFYTEMTIAHSAPGTYFMAAGWNKGYFGMQELGNGKKLLIFSVWDSGLNDPKAVAKDKQVKLLHKDAKVRVGRFGGEGTGGQSFFDYNWKIGQPYRFLVTSKLNGMRTEYAGYFFVPETKKWRHLVTFSTVTGGKPLGGYYSFVEDFKRDRVSTTKERRARYGNGWVKTTKGEWQELTQARFTGDSNPVMNIDSGEDKGVFFLATGGKVANKGTKLNATMKRPAAKRPDDLPVK
jgi:hypothetical protein